MEKPWKNTIWWTERLEPYIIMVLYILLCKFMGEEWATMTHGRDFQIVRTLLIQPNASILGILSLQKKMAVFRHWKTTMKHREFDGFLSAEISSSRVAVHRHYFHPVCTTGFNAMMMMMPTEDLICTGCGFLAKIKWMMDEGGRFFSEKNPKAASEMRHNIRK